MGGLRKVELTSWNMLLGNDSEKTWCVERRLVPQFKKEVQDVCAQNISVITRRIQNFQGKILSTQFGSSVFPDQLYLGQYSTYCNVPKSFYDNTSLLLYKESFIRTEMNEIALYISYDTQVSVSAPSQEVREIDGVLWTRAVRPPGRELVNATVSKRHLLLQGACFTTTAITGYMYEPGIVTQNFERLYLPPK